VRYNAVSIDKIEKDGTTPHTSHVAKLVPIPKVLRNKSPIFCNMGFLFCPNAKNDSLMPFFACLGCVFRAFKDCYFCN
jgi:hypothetical protein